MKNRTVVRRALFSLIFVSAVLSVIAQKAPMKYGKVDPADLSMTVYSPDSSAAAVVLCNYGYFDSNNIQFVHQMRIKILKEEGKVFGDIHVPASEKTNVKGQTINMEDGKPVITKLGKDGIFIEKVDRDSYRARAAMPNVKVGSVIDVEFYYQGLPPSWNFQKTIPVRWSELVIEQSPYFNFRKNFSGYVSLSESSDDRWVAKDVPAFKTEPYTNNPDNYVSRFEIELSRINIPGRYREYATSWEAVASTLRTSDSFGMQFRSFNLFLNGVEKEVKSAASTPEEKLIKAFDSIKKIKWNKSESVWPSTSELGEAFRKKIGNVSDINLCLLILLRKLDIDANPVVLSTRSNGTLPLYSVSFDKLNYVIVSAQIGEKNYLLDATEENCPYYLLPERVLNGRGLIIKNEGIEWTDLKPSKKEKTYSLLNLKLSTDGVLKGEWNKTRSDYAALDYRNHYKTFNSEDDYLKSLESSYMGLSVDKYSVSDMDSLHLPVKEAMEVTIKNKVKQVGGQMFVGAMLYDQYTENPFKAPERQYPVDFATPVEETTMMILELPEGYTVEQLPKSVKMALPENVATFQMQSMLNENKVQVLFKLNINTPVFYQNQYLDLKSFFDELVKKQAEMLVIKKTA